MLEKRRGHNYEYWNDDKHNTMIKNGWKLWDFSDYLNRLEDKEAIHREDIAQYIVKRLRNTGYFARIVCGLRKDIQRTKYYSVIYKEK